MTQYDLTHPLCGAKWQDVYDERPIKIRCIKCGQWVNSTYTPTIFMVGLHTNKFEEKLH